MAETTTYESFLRSQSELPISKKYEIEMPETVLLSRYTNEVFAHFYQKLLETKPRMATVLANPSFVDNRCNNALAELQAVLYAYHQSRGAVSGCHYRPDGTYTSSANVRTFFNLYTFWKYGPAPGAPDKRIDSVADLVEVLQEEQHRPSLGTGYQPEKKGPHQFMEDSMLACFLYGIIQAEKNLPKPAEIELERDLETGLWKAGFFYADFQGMATTLSKNCVKKGSRQFEEQVVIFTEICPE